MPVDFSYLARVFDTPTTSDAHRSLEDSAWMGGSLVSVRYYLGRLVNQNMFRLSDEQVSQTLERFIAPRSSPRGAALLATGPGQGWEVAQVLLRHLLELQVHGRARLSVKHAAAIEGFLKNPDLDQRELARIARTTEKQLNRTREIIALRRILWLQQRKKG